MLTLIQLQELLCESCIYVTVESKRQNRTPKLITWSDLFGMIKAVIN